MKKRLLAMIMTLAMCLSLLPTAAFAVSTSPAVDGKYESGDWVQSGNGTVSYTVQDENGNKVPVVLSKTAEPTKDPNKFNITLQVQTSTVTTNPAAVATVLVMDMSTSMRYCADCGEDLDPMWGEPNHANDCAGKKNNNVKSRLTVAKEAAIAFVNSYDAIAKGEDHKADGSGLGRYISIVRFDTSASVAQQWVDVSTKKGYGDAIDAINDLSYDGYTNLDDGLYHANQQLSDTTIPQNVPDTLTNRNVVVLSDGAPTTYRGNKQPPSMPGQGNKTYLDKTTQTATNLQKEATVYTVCFGAINEKCYDDATETVSQYLANHVASSTDKAFTATDASKLSGIFGAIEEGITSGLTGDGAVVTDPMSEYVTLDAVPSDAAELTGEEGLSWVLSNPKESTNADTGTTTYTYTLTYQVTLKPDYQNGNIYPANAPTYLKLNANADPLYFPVPGLQGEAVRTAIFTGETASKVYNGAEQELTGVTSELPNGYTSNVTYSAKGTYVSDSPYAGTITAPGDVVIYNANGENVTNSFASISTTPGKLTIIPKLVTITADSDEKVYDGTALTKNSYKNTDLATGDTIKSVTVNGSQTDVGSAENVASGAVIMKGEADVTANYTISYEEGTLTVTQKPLTITAGSAERPYNGRPLTKDSYENTDLATGDKIDSVTVTGSQTEVGESANVPSEAVIENAAGDDVTGNYNITYANGTLEVIKRLVTLTSGSASKLFDGEPLTNSTITVGGDGFVEGQGATYDVTGTQTAVGSSANTFTYTLNEGTNAGNYEITLKEGKLTVTKIEEEIVITADSDSKKYDGSALTDSGYTYTQGILQDGDVLTAVVEGTITDVGTAANKVTSYKVMRGETDVTAKYTFGKSVDGTLEVTKRSVVLTSGTDTKKYDGSALTKAGIDVTGDGFVEGEGATYNVTGSQTDAGNTANTFTYALDNNTKAKNYEITQKEGTLTVTKRAVTLTSATDSKVYDGEPLTNSEVSVGGDGFVTGEGATYNVTGSLTDPGTADNKFTYTLKNNTKADNYEITKIEGKLTVTKIVKEIVITAASGEKVYDGTPLTNGNYTYTEGVLAEGDVLTAVVEGTITNVGTAENEVTSYQVMRGETDVTANYNFGESVDGVLKVTPVKITITAGNDTKVYDGTALTKNSYELKAGKLVSGDSIESITVTGSQTIVGSSDNVPSAAVIKNEKDVDVTDNYEITYANGTLTVTKKAITITAASGEKVYDGTPLTKDNYTSTDLAAGDSIESVRVTGTQTKVGTSNNIPSALRIVNADGENVTFCYQETYVNGTLKVTPKTLTITADSGTKVYDGTELIKDSATGAGLAAGDRIASVTVTGSQTVVGTSNNVPTAAVIENAAGEDVTASYTISYANGTLEVTKKPITITADSDTKVYDGTALTKNSYTNTELATGDSIESVTVTGSQTIVGSSDNVPSAAVIKNAAGDVVTSNYEITYANGTLEVTPKALTITADGDSKVYDGTALTKNSYTKTDLAEGDEIASVTVTGSQTVVGTSNNVPTAAVIKNASGEDVTASYTISYANGTLEVTKKPITITADSDSKRYDGTALTKNSYTSTELVAGDKIESVTVTGSQTEVGKSDNVPSAAVIKNAAGEDVSASYEVTYVNGTLEVTKKPSPKPPMDIPDNPPALNKVDHFAYIVGYPDGNVEPQGNITRAEVATIFFRMLTDESRDEFWSQSSDYSDVTATKWFNNAVCTLSNGGIITGYADGTFKPNGNITRAEFATMAVRFFSASYEGESLFPDIDQHWAKDYINTAAYEGLINGYEDGTFRPNQPITRAEAMAIVNRVLDRHPDKANLLEDMIQWPDNMDTEKWYYADVQEATNSHDYDMEGTEAEPYEVWTEILPVRDWVAFEKEWSDSNSAEGGEVMK